MSLVSFLYSYFRCQERQQSNIQKVFKTGQREPRVLYLAKLSFKYKHFLRKLLENRIQASQEVSGETSKDWRSQFIDVLPGSLDDWKADRILLLSSCPTVYEMQKNTLIVMLKTRKNVLGELKKVGENSCKVESKWVQIQPEETRARKIAATRVSKFI